VFVRNVGLVGVDAAAAVRALPDHLLRGLGIRAKIDDDIRPGMRQRQSNALADAGVGAGYQGLLPFQDLADGAGRHHDFGQDLVLQ
jgi:hypothetical protein